MTTPWVLTVCPAPVPVAGAYVERGAVPWIEAIDITALVTVILKVTSIVVESSLLVTVIVTAVAGWVAVGVPVISPVVGSSDRPAGRVLPALSAKP